MDWIRLILIGISLAMDAFAVAVTSGIAIRNMRIEHALRIGLFFGFFQALMPYIGWNIGGFVNTYLSSVDHWVAFALLAFVGGKMIWESLLPEDKTRESNPLNIYLLFSLAIATSIDAFAVGISFSLLGMTIVVPIIIIGTVTFIMSFAGVYLGNRLGHHFNEKRLETIGGILLIGIGLKILYEHLF